MRNAFLFTLLVAGLAAAESSLLNAGTGLGPVNKLDCRTGGSPAPVPG